MPEADDAPARDDADETGGTDEAEEAGQAGVAGIEAGAGELPVPVESVAVPDHGLEVPDADVLSVPDAGLTVPDAGVEPPDVTLEPPRVSMPALPETGESRVDAAVRPLADLGEQPTEEHVGTYEAAHNGLQDVLADLDRDTDGHT